MSWDEWVDVQMEARPISGRANQASRTLFHGPRVALSIASYTCRMLFPSLGLEVARPRLYRQDNFLLFGDKDKDKGVDYGFHPSDKGFGVDFIVNLE
eukprot:scaffold16443_cov106-Isochrysis_galbana.AAC.2